MLVLQLKDRHYATVFDVRELEQFHAMLRSPDAQVWKWPVGSVLRTKIGDLLRTAKHDQPYASMEDRISMALFCAQPNGLTPTQLKSILELSRYDELSETLEQMCSSGLVTTDLDAFEDEPLFYLSQSLDVGETFDRVTNAPTLDVCILDLLDKHPGWRTKTFIAQNLGRPTTAIEAALTSSISSGDVVSRTKGRCTYYALSGDETAKLKTKKKKKSTETPDEDFVVLPDRDRISRILRTYKSIELQPILNITGLSLFRVNRVLTDLIAEGKAVCVDGKYSPA